MIGQILQSGEFKRGPDVTWLACLPPASADPIAYVLPADVDPGPYLLCVNDRWSTTGCAQITISP